MVGRLKAVCGVKVGARVGRLELPVAGEGGEETEGAREKLWAEARRAGAHSWYQKQWKNHLVQTSCLKEA